MSDQLYVEDLKKEDPLPALIARLSIIGARVSVSSKSSAISDESKSKNTSKSIISASSPSSNQKPIAMKIDIQKAKQQIQDVDKNFAIKIKGLREILKAASVFTDIYKNSLQESEKTIIQFQQTLDLVSIVAKKIDLMLQEPE